MKLPTPLIATLLCVAILLPGCKSSSEERKSHASYIIDDDNIRPLDAATAKGIDPKIIHASVLIVTVLNKQLIKFCSGVLIKSATDNAVEVLTNHHCFADVNDQGVVNRLFNADACNETQVYFGYMLLNALKATKIACLKGSLISDPTGDIAKFRLESTPPLGTETLGLWTDPPPMEERRAVVIHYPNHKDEVPGATFSLNSNIPSASVTIDNCTTKGTFPKETWGVEQEIRLVLRHTCDLVHGSSGSALVDLETSKILGINWGGIKLQYPNHSSTDNVATNSLYVQAFLNGTLDAYKASIFSDSAVATRGGNSSSANAELGTINRESNGGTTKKSNQSACGWITPGQMPVAPNQTILLLLFIIPLFRGFL
jgi:hypothetical protein